MKLKQGPQVREGLIVVSSRFEYDTDRYGEATEDLIKSCHFTVPVVINRSRVMATRAKFDTPGLAQGLCKVSSSQVRHKVVRIVFALYQ